MSGKTEELVEFLLNQGFVEFEISALKEAGEDAHSQITLSGIAPEDLQRSRDDLRGTGYRIIHTVGKKVPSDKTRT